MILQRELQRESTWCCSVIPSADVKILVLPWIQPETELYSPGLVECAFGFSWCGCKSRRLRSRTSPQSVAPMLRSILLSYSMNRVWSDFPETANAEERLLWVVAQFNLLLSSEVVADSQFPRRASSFNFSAGVRFSNFFSVVLTAYEIVFKFWKEHQKSSFLEFFLFYVLQWTLWLISITKQQWQCFSVP